MKIIRTRIINYEEKIPVTLEDFKEWEFSLGVITGDDFKIFAREFRKFIKSNLPEGAELIKFNIGHYFLSGFIKRNNNYVYFSISDV